jgi:hypothetical protein
MLDLSLGETPLHRLEGEAVVGQKGGDEEGPQGGHKAQGADEDGGTAEAGYALVIVAGGGLFLKLEEPRAHH